MASKMGFHVRKIHH